MSRTVKTGGYPLTLSACLLDLTYEALLSEDEKELAPLLRDLSSKLASDHLRDAPVAARIRRLLMELGSAPNR